MGKEIGPHGQNAVLICIYYQSQGVTKLNCSSCLCKGVVHARWEIRRDVWGRGSVLAKYLYWKHFCYLLTCSPSPTHVVLSKDPSEQN